MDRGAKKPVGPSAPLDVAAAAHQLGAYLAFYRQKVLRVSQAKMAERLSLRLEAGARGRGVSENTYRKMESGDPTVNFTYWLSVFEEFGTLTEVIHAAEPGTEAFHALVSSIPGYEEVRR